MQERRNEDGRTKNAAEETLLVFDVVGKGTRDFGVSGVRRASFLGAGSSEKILLVVLDDAVMELTGSPSDCIFPWIHNDSPSPSLGTHLNSCR